MKFWIKTSVDTTEAWNTQQNKNTAVMRYFAFLPWIAAQRNFDWLEISKQDDLIPNPDSSQLFTKLENKFLNLVYEKSVVLRAISQDQLTLIENYGCWCHFDQKRSSNKGKPVDQYDELCRYLHEGYACLKIDHEDSCDPLTTIYNSSTGSGGLDSSFTTERLVEECYASNVSPCQTNLCIIEGYFVQNIFKLMFQQFYYPEVAQFSGKTGAFDKEIQCSILGSSNDSELSCCGVYPERFPFKSQDGGRACCKNKTFATEFYVCCENGTVKPPGQC